MPVTEGTLRARGSDNDSRDRVVAKGFKHILGVLINVNLVLLELRDFRNVLILALTLFFLKLEGNTTDRTALDTFHKMSRVSSNLVAETLGSNDSNLIDNPLIGLEVQCKTRVVFLDNYARSSLRSFGAYTTLCFVSNFYP